MRTYTAWLDAKETGELLKVDKALATIRAHHCAVVHPARLARGLADCVEGLGVRIYEHSPVQDIKDLVLTTAQAKVKAETDSPHH